MSRYLLPALIVAFALGGCGEPSDPNDNLPDTEIAKSDKQRITSPAVSPEDLAQLTRDNAAFAVELFQKLRAKGGNVFYSPHSISTALAMTYGGARTTTEAAMAKVLHYALGQGALHPAFNALDLELASRGQGAAGKDGGKFRLNIANALWGQRDYSFLPSFLDLLALNYGAGMHLMNFKDQPEPSRLTINDWVAQKTEDRIKDLIPQGEIDSETKLVLTNAVYFNAAWMHAFEKSATERGEFTRLDGSKLTAELMNKTGRYGYASAGGWEAVELPYDGGELSMVVMLPAAGLEQAEAALTPESLQKLIGAIDTEEVALTLPKFKVESTFKLKEALAQLGMGEAFSGAADFSGIDGRKYLVIGQVMHKAFIAIDEAGTEAAAATAVIMPPGAMPDPPRVVRVDRPFLFVIRDIATGAILFVGRVVEPKLS